MTFGMLHALTLTSRVLMRSWIQTCDYLVPFTVGDLGPNNLVTAMEEPLDVGAKSENIGMGP